MTVQDLITHFGGITKAQRALGVSRSLWWHWKRHGIPRGRQFEIQVQTGGALRAQA